jgi:hypothetical protein
MPPQFSLIDADWRGAEAVTEHAVTATGTTAGSAFFKLYIDIL